MIQADDEVYQSKSGMFLHVILSEAKDLQNRRANRSRTQILRFAQDDMGRDYRSWSVKFIIGDVRDQSAPSIYVGRAEKVPLSLDDLSFFAML